MTEKRSNNPTTNSNRFSVKDLQIGRRRRKKSRQNFFVIDKFVTGPRNLKRSVAWKMIETVRVFVFEVTMRKETLK